MIANPIHILDADLTISGERYSDINVWYRAFGKKDDGSIDADDFFSNLPELTRLQYGTIGQYWKVASFDPEERNKQIADYLFMKSDFPALEEANLLMTNVETTTNSYRFDTANC